MAKAFDEFSKAAAAGSLKTIKVVVFNASLYPIFLSNIITAKGNLAFNFPKNFNGKIYIERKFVFKTDKQTG